MIATLTDDGHHFGTPAPISHLRFSSSTSNVHTTCAHARTSGDGQARNERLSCSFTGTADRSHPSKAPLSASATVKSEGDLRPHAHRLRDLRSCTPLCWLQFCCSALARTCIMEDVLPSINAQIDKLSIRGLHGAASEFSQQYIGEVGQPL